MLLLAPIPVPAAPQPLAVLPLVGRSVPEVRATIGGRSVRMILDTGVAVSYLSLPEAGEDDTPLLPSVTLPSVTLASVVPSRPEPSDPLLFFAHFVPQRTTVPEGKGFLQSTSATGSGVDWARHYAIDLDFARKRITLVDQAPAVVEIYDPAGAGLLERLLAAHPEWGAGLVAGRFSPVPGETVHPRLEIPSAHPTIRTPLGIDLGENFTLSWYGGDFYDFLGKEAAADAFDFLGRFFDERVLRGVCWQGEEMRGGGPYELDEPESDAWGWFVPDYDRIELRSWRGNRDRVFLVPPAETRGGRRETL